MNNPIDKLINSALYTDEERYISEVLMCSCENAKVWIKTIEAIWEKAKTSVSDRRFLYNENYIIHYENWQISCYVMNPKNGYIEVRVSKFAQDYLTVRLDNNLEEVLLCVFSVVK